MYGWNGVDHMGGMWFWWIIGIAAVAAIVWAAAKPSGRSGSSADLSAEEILKRRYAAGEIGKDEFDQRLQDLRR